MKARDSGQVEGASPGGDPGRAALPMQALAWLLLPVLAIGAGQLRASPGDMPPVALAVGPAVVVAMQAAHASRGRCVLLLAIVLAACELVAQRISQPFGLDLAQRLLDGLGSGALVAWQACFTSRQVQRILAELARDRRPPPLRRLSATARLVVMSLLPLALVAGLAIVGLHLVMQALSDAHDAMQDLEHLRLLFYSHVLASTLSVLLAVPLLGRVPAPRPGGRLLLGIVAGALVLGLALGQSMGAMYALPLYTFLGGWLGGMFGAALSVLLSLSLLLHVDGLLVGASPFNGPDGYVVLLATTFRLMVVGMLGMVWNEPRARHARRRTERDARSGAATFRNVMALEWHLARAGYGRGARSRRPVLWLHIDLPVNRPEGSHSTLAPLSAAQAPDDPASGPEIQMMTIGPIGSLTPAGAQPSDNVDAPLRRPHGDGLDSSLPSPRLPALMQALARGLRGHDAVVPIAGEALIVLVDDLERAAVANVVQRLDVLLLREGRRHLAPAEIRQAVQVHAGAAAFLLTSARYLSIDL
ncbi:hypothetical protein [Leptothrix discophora]|uniref:FUSC family protein n=1 Tax=Leptothrix discophora TaxID=89 RepID=A0ABT9G2S8_LEPDI|nr:hypothetical protein [Leptothrix discophora]MDP4300716.1 hypothetical protein [Leptothrix discophora]